MTWTVSTARDGIVGRHASFESARRATWQHSRSDRALLLMIHDPSGRLYGLYQDGKEA